MSLEAILSFLAFLAVIGLFIGVLGETEAKGSTELNAFKAKANCIECTAILDSLYSNAVELSQGKELECFVDGNAVKSSVQGKTKQSVLLAENAKLVSVGGKVSIEMRCPKHYGEME